MHSTSPYIAHLCKAGTPASDSAHEDGLTGPPADQQLMLLHAFLTSAQVITVLYRYGSVQSWQTSQ